MHNLDLFCGEIGGRLSKIFVPALKNFCEQMRNLNLFRVEIGGRLSKIFVPALKNFYELCATRGAVENA